MGGVTRWVPPDELGEYRLVRHLGQGGMGQIYVGHDTLLDRPVAIKFIASVDPDRVTRQRFLIEARAIARLQHPNVVAIYRVGEIDGRPYLVYELVHGQSLNRISVPVDWRLALKLGIGLSRGLAAAHRRNVLHRDIKPANAMLAGDGEVKLLDFGLAKLLDDGGQIEWLAAAGDVRARRVTTPPSPDDTPSIPAGDTLSVTPEPPSSFELTAPGAVMGTPSYMAPEIWRHEPATMRSDVYSMGVLLHFLCVGRPPHQAATIAELGRRVTTVDAAALAQQVGEVDPGLAAVVDRCLARDPAQRPASGDELREALERLETGARAAVIPDGNPYRGLRPFEAEHRALFFGRDADVRAVLDRLRSEPWVLVAGDSGVGKSSLCRAGVLPRIADGELDPARSWTAITLAPGLRPIEALASPLAPYLGVSHPELTAGLVADPGHLRGRLLAQGSGRGCAILIDQLEELVTLSDKAEARAVAAAIGELTVRLPGVALLATVRGDFLTRLAALPGIAEHITRAFHLVRPLSPEGVTEAIAGPARATGFAFESSALLTELAASVSIADGGLPLLQFALAELWEARDPATRQITGSALARLGGVAGALARHADAVIASLPQADRDSARRVLLALITSENTRARRGDRELIERAPRALGVLDALVRGRLVVARDTESGPVYEIAHEALIESWDTLRAWIDEDAGTRVVRERVVAAAAEWERAGYAGDALWGERRLAELPALEAGGPDDRAGRFLTASRRAVVRRRRIRRLSAVTAAAITAAVVVVLVSLNRQSQDRLRRLHEEQGRQSLVSGDPMRGLVNLAEAYREGARGTPLRFMLADGFRELGALEVSLNGHRDRVWSVAFSPDGARVVTASEDGTARLWDAGGAHLHTLSGHTGRVLAARFSPDGSRVATASFDTTARIWDAGSGVARCTMPHPAPVLAVVFSPDGTQLTTAAMDGLARIWDPASCRLLHELAPAEHRPRPDFQPVELVAYDPSGSRLAVWNDRGAPSVWDPRTGQLIRVLEGHRGFMLGIAFAPDGGRVVAGFVDGAAAIFDADAGRELLELSGHRGPITSARFSADGRQVLTTSEDGSARVWDAASGAVRLSLEHPGIVRFAQWSPDARWIVTTDSDGGVRSWDAATGRLETSFPGHVDEVWAVAFDARGDRFATAGSDGTAKIWNARWSRQLRSFQVPLPVNRILRGRGDTFGAISGDGALVMTVGGGQADVHLWDLATGRPLATLAGHPGGTEGGDFSPDGRTLVTCGDDRTVKLWSVAERRLERSLEGHGDRVERARFNPDGSQLVTASRDGTARIWDVASGRAIATLHHGKEVLDARFSPDGTRVVTGARDGIARIWDPAGAGEAVLLKGHTDKVISAMFSPDGRQILSASGDKTARIWDVRSARQLLVLEGHKAEVLDAAFSPDGQLIATASLDATLRVWDTTGRLLMVASQPYPVLSITWSRDGRHLLTTALDGSSQLWAADLESRSPADVEAALRCRVPFRLEHERVVGDTETGRCP
jgi:WD40 repeat protein/serine/threonine protein kinase